MSLYLVTILNANFRQCCVSVPLVELLELLEVLEASHRAVAFKVVNKEGYIAKASDFGYGYFPKWVQSFQPFFSTHTQ